MADKIIFEVVATAKGVKVVQQQTDKLAKSTDKAEKSTKRLDKSRDAYNRREKGAANISSNATKNFSKMQQGIDGGGGSGGLVRAYALLAANVFALTAAFGVLSRSAQIDTLTRSMEILSTTGGTYIKTLAMDLRDASGGAVDLAQSFRQVSLATSAGLNVKEIEGLTMVAKGAALSLGRDLPDAMDRIFRGAIKLEPEILDEIGLFVRVDEAAEKYARQLGKSASALSQAEKRQGFLNEILDQGSRKFQQYADEIKPDPYVKIAAALSDVAQSALSLANSAFGPLIGFLAESKTLLTLVFGAVVFSLLRLAIPAIGQFNQGLAESAQKAADNARDYAKGISDTTKAQIKEDNTKVKSALKAQQQINRARKPLALKVGGKDASSKLEADLQNKEIKGAERLEKVKKRIANLEKKQGLEKRRQIEGYDEELAALREELRLEQQITDLRTREGKAKTVSDPGTNAAKKQALLDQRAMTSGALATITGTAETKGLGVAFDELKGKLRETEKVGGKTVKTFRGMNRGLFALRGAFGIAAVGASTLMMSLGPIMMIIGLATPLLIALAKSMGLMSEEAKKASESVDKLNQVTENINSRIKSQTDQMKESSLGFTEQAKAAAAFSKSLQDISARTIEAGKALDDFNRESGFFAKSLDFILGLGGGGTTAAAETAIIKGAVESLGGAIRAGEEDLVSLFSSQLEGSEGYVEAVRNQIVAEQKSKKAFEDLEKSKGKQSTNEMNAIKKVAAMRAEAERKRQSGDKDAAKILDRIADTLRNKLNPEQQVAADAYGDMQRAQVSVTNSTVGLDGNLNDLIDSTTLFNETIDGKAVGGLAKYDSFVQGLSSTLDDAGQSVLKANAAFITTTAIDDLAGSFIQLNEKLITTKKVGGEVKNVFNEEFAKDLGSNDSNPFATLFTKKERDVLKDGGDAAFDVWNKVTQRVLFYRKTLITTKTEVKALNDLIKKFGAVGAINDKLFTMQAKKQSELAIVQRDAANAQFANRLRLKNMDEDEFNTMKDILSTKTKEVDKVAALVGMNMTLEEFYAAQADHHAAISARMAEEVASLTESERAGIQITKAAQARVTAQKELNKQLQTEEKLNMQIAQAGRTGSTKLSASKEAQLSVQSALDSFEIAKQEVTLKMAMLDYEMRIQQVKLEVLAKQTGEDFGQRRSVNEDGSVNKASGMFAELDNAQTITMEALQKQLDNAPKNLQVTIANAVSSGFKGGVQGGLVGLQTTLDAIDDNKTMSSTEKADSKQTAQMTALRESTNLLAEDLKKLGPEGELVAAVAQGAMTMADAFDTMTTSIENGGSKMAARAAFAAQAIGQISSIMAANSKAQIAEIDKQIDAEKKRDGKSAESITKLKALEAKKEAMKRKAFEQDKKMKMAQVVTATAAAIMQTLATAGAFALPMAVMMGAMGAAQLAIIQKSKYSGGSSEVEKPAMGSLAIGKRDNKVDVSRGPSSGELAYMRGARGTGTNANNFTTTGGAYGMRSYAHSGEGILVGEQGPEVIQPTQPVDVIPMGTGGAQNVNFTINAVDADGIETVLENQRGNIIGMIRSAANGYGAGFLEEVDTDVVSSGGYQKA